MGSMVPPKLKIKSKSKGLNNRQITDTLCFKSCIYQDGPWFLFADTVLSYHADAKMLQLDSSDDFALGLEKHTSPN